MVYFSGTETAIKILLDIAIGSFPWAKVPDAC